MTWFRDVASCLGLSGSISILQQFFGYSERISKAYKKTDPRYPGNVSLLDQMKLLKNGPHIRIHIKIVDPQWKRISIDRSIYAMRQLYGKNGIGVVIKSTEYLNISPDFLDIYVDNCKHGPFTGPSNEQNELFLNNFNYVEILHTESGWPYTREIVVFFVREITTYAEVFAEVTGAPPVGGADGCASHPGGHPGAVVKFGASRWVLPHEVGHDLGLEHADDEDEDPPYCLPNRLMTDCPIGENPELVASEVQTMLSSGLTYQC